MNNKELAELLKYSSDKSMLIVNPQGRLVELRCPFIVEVMQNVGTLHKGDVESVAAVKITVAIINVYIINEKAYYYYYFNIKME